MPSCLPAANAQTTLPKCASLSEPFLLTGTKYGHTQTTSPNFKSLDSLDSWVRTYVSMMNLGVNYKYYAADKMSWSRTLHSDDGLHCIWIVLEEKTWSNSDLQGDHVI